MVSGVSLRLRVKRGRTHIHVYQPFLVYTATVLERRPLVPFFCWLVALSRGDQTVCWTCFGFRKTCMARRSTSVCLWRLGFSLFLCSVEERFAESDEHLRLDNASGRFEWKVRSSLLTESHFWLSIFVLQRLCSSR